MRKVRTQKAAGSAYPLIQVKEHLRVNGYDDENGLIQAYINAAVEDIRKWTWVHLDNANRTAYLDNWEELDEGEVLIHAYPISEITSIKYYDADGVLQTMSSGTDYYASLNGQYARIYFENTPTLRDQQYDNIEIAYKCGYASHFEIPDDLVDALFMLVADKFDNRNSLTTGMASNYNEVPMSVKAILNNNSLRNIG